VQPLEPATMSTDGEDDQYVIKAERDFPYGATCKELSTQKAMAMVSWRGG
jgi:hypothetical protein